MIAVYRRLIERARICEMAVTRQELYVQVWAEPMGKVAARHEVSASFLVRVCDRLNVPRPPRGYWMKLAVGKAPLTPVLPDVQPGHDVEWVPDSGLPRPPRAVRRPPKFVPGGVRRSTRHGVLVGAREHFAEAKVLDGGYLRPLKKRVVDIFVTKGTLDRALEVASALFDALEASGHHVEFADLNEPLIRLDLDERCEAGAQRYGHTSWHPDRPTLVYVGKVPIALTLFELSEVCEVRYVDGRWVRLAELRGSKRMVRGGPLADLWTSKHDMPTGRLCLRASSPNQLAEWERRWTEEKAGGLAGKVPQIVRELGVSAKAIAALVAEGERQAEIERRQWEAEREAWLRDEAEKRRAQNTKDSRDELFGIIERWAVAKQVEAFFEDAERRATTLTESEPDDLRDRLRRARALLGGTDALQKFRAWKAPEER